MQRFVNDEPINARRIGSLERLGRWCRRNPAVASLIAAVLVLMAAGTTASTRQAVVANLARADLAAKNTELKDEQAKVQARFELAQKAIALFHTGVSEDALLKHPQFKDLRTKLLKEAAAFYADLEKLLAGQTDAKSRHALAAAYFQLGELTEKIGEKAEALGVHRKALALRIELAPAAGADRETRLDLARSLRAVGILLMKTGDVAGALRAWEQQRDIATALEAETASDQAATDAVRAVLAQSHNAIGVVLMDTGRPTEALQAHQKALALRQKLADANPAVAQYRSDLALSHFNIGKMLTGIADTPAVNQTALREFGKALAIWQELADANRAVTLFQEDLAYTYGMISILLSRTGHPEEAVLAVHNALAIQQKLVDDHPAVTEFQADLAWSHNQFAWMLIRQKRLAEAFTAVDAGLTLLKKLTEADPENTGFARGLGHSYAYRGWALVRSGQPSKAGADLRRALELWAKVKASSLDDRFERSRALALLAGLGGEATSGVTTSEAARFADQAVASLRDAFSAGWGESEELNEPDFDSLRGRRDFQKLVAEVATRQKAKAAKNAEKGTS